jgi:hypothetical protein
MSLSAAQERLTDGSKNYASARRWRCSDPGAGKTKRAHVWAYARGAFEATQGVI